MSHSTLGNGEWLLVGNSLFSQDGGTEFKMQVDGKICVYARGGCVYQSTASQRNDIKGIKMETNGVLNIYDNSGNVTWTSNNDHPGDSTTVAAVQNDGNVCLYKGTPIWATQTKG